MNHVTREHSVYLEFWFILPLYFFTINNILKYTI